MKKLAKTFLKLVVFSLAVIFFTTGVRADVIFNDDMSNVRVYRFKTHSQDQTNDSSVVSEEQAEPRLLELSPVKNNELDVNKSALSTELIIISGMVILIATLTSLFIIRSIRLKKDDNNN